MLSRNLYHLPDRHIKYSDIAVDVMFSEKSVLKDSMASFKQRLDRLIALATVSEANLHTSRLGIPAKQTLLKSFFVVGPNHFLTGYIFLPEVSSWKQHLWL